MYDTYVKIVDVNDVIHKKGGDLQTTKLIKYWKK